MPGWHALTEPHRKAGRLKVVGILQEQHPDRCALFMQWKQMDWPVWLDALNLLQLPAVPYTLLVDEDGRIESVNPTQETFFAFMEKPPRKRELYSSQPLDRSPEWKMPRLPSDEALEVSAWLEAGQGFFQGSWSSHSMTCLKAFQQALLLEPENGWIHFRLGVVYGRLFDEDPSKPMPLFARAISHWKQALALDPNQYIWRRRLQQYGPRLDKPYAFYDWIDAARSELLARGETPVPLKVEPSGAEIAKPIKDVDFEVTGASMPDPDGRIQRAAPGLIEWSHVSVSHTQRERRSIRVHMQWQPAANSSVEWNNEAEPLTFWLEATPGWKVQPASIQVPGPPMDHDREVRSLEFECQASEDAAALEIRGVALFSICESSGGPCLYRRLDWVLSHADLFPRQVSPLLP
ncbi:MAG: hypothetical protein ACO3PO_06405 [Limisphaerales bacterium]